MYSKKIIEGEILMKYSFLFIIMLTLIITSNTIYAQSELHYYVNPKDIIPKEDIVTVYLNDEILNFDIVPYTKKGHTMVQLRPIYEMFGLTLLWNHQTKTITGIKDDTNISLRLGDHIILVNQKKIFSEIEPYTLDGHTMVPIRVIAESLGASVSWDSINRIVNINLKE